jgi:hypothetical protein
MRAALIALALAAPAALEAAPRPRPAPQKPEPKPPEPPPSGPKEAEPKPPAPPPSGPKEADRHFKNGVGLFKEAKYSEALAEFERAYEIAPHPLVLYNIAGCHRALSHYGEAVAYYQRFLADGNGRVPAARLSDAQVELTALLALIARVTVTITPAGDDAALIVDGTPRDKAAMPLFLPPGEHRLVARAAGRRDAEQVVHVAAGDVVPVELALGELLVTQPIPPPRIVGVARDITEPAYRRFALGAGFGTNLRLVGDTGAPALGAAAAIGSRFELGVDVVLVAYAVVPSVRVRLVGDMLALHVVGAAPIAFKDGPTTDRFVAGALGIGLRYRPMPRLAVRLESYASFAGQAHGTTIPTFLGGELWF